MEKREEAPTAGPPERACKYFFLGEEGDLTKKNRILVSVENRIPVM
jgi:hypothetical protein